jgi:hypothetical protein
MEDVLVAQCLLQVGVEPLATCHMNNIMKQVYGNSRSGNTHTDTSGHVTTEGIININTNNNNSNNDNNNNNNNNNSDEGEEQQYTEEIFHAVSPRMAFSHIDW